MGILSFLINGGIAGAISGALAGYLMTFLENSRKETKELKDKIYKPLLMEIEENHKQISNMQPCLPEGIQNKIRTIKYDMPSKLLDNLIQYEKLLKFYFENLPFYTNEGFAQFLKENIPQLHSSEKSDRIKVYEELISLSESLIKMLKNIKNQSFIIFAIKSKLNLF